MERLLNLLTDAQKIRLMLYSFYGKDAQDALNFIMAATPEMQSINQGLRSGSNPADLMDGVYFCLKNGATILYTGQTEMENVDHIGIIMGGMAFGVQLRDKGEFALYKDYEKCPKQADYYTSQNGRSCHEDFDCIKATERIKKIGTDIPLMDSEYIPCIRHWDIMGMFKSQLQAALKAAGGDVIAEDDWYWSASEYSQGHAWVVYFSNGGTNLYYKSGSTRVRAVVAF